MNAAREDRLLLKSRIIIDLFGPLIDVSVLPPFRNIEKARYLSLPRLINAANQNKPLWQRRWNEQRVLSYVLTALKNRSPQNRLVDMKILEMLVKACGHGTQVVVVSTAPDAAVFEAARRAIVDAAARFGGSDNLFEFKRINEKLENSWAETLTDLKKIDDRYTHVLHDLPAADVGVITSDLYDEWVPNQMSMSKDLQELLTQEIEREQRQVALIPWLDTQETMSLDDYKVIGDFMLFDEPKRMRLKQGIEDIIELRANRPNEPVCVYLMGSSAAGKSFFVEQFRRKIDCQELQYAHSSLSGIADDVGQLFKAVEAHVREIVEKQALVAFLDEVDTVVLKSTAFRYLMEPMTGKVRDSEGKFKEKLGGVIWFVAGSSGKNRDEIIEAFLKKSNLKMGDFFSRIDMDIVLAGVDSPFDALLLGAAILKQEYPGLKEIEKKVLLAYALAKWRDARQLRRTIELVRIKVPPCQSMSLHVMMDNCSDEILKKALERAKAQRLDGYMKVD